MSETNVEVPEKPIVFTGTANGGYRPPNTVPEPTKPLIYREKK